LSRARQIHVEAATTHRRCHTGGRAVAEILSTRGDRLAARIDALGLNTELGTEIAREVVGGHDDARLDQYLLYGLVEHGDQNRAVA